MQTESNQKANQEQTSDSGWLPPRGIRFFERLGRPTPFYVQWKDPDFPADARKFKTQSFPKASDRERFAKSLAANLDLHGRTALRAADPEKVAMWKKFEEIVGPDVDPLVVAVEWKQMRNAGSAAGSAITVKEAVEKYLELRKAEHGDAGGYGHMKTQLGHHFVGKFGSMRLHEVTGEMLREWLPTVISRKTRRKIGKLTQIDYRKHLNMFFERAVNVEKWAASNPCNAIIRPKVEESEIKLLSVEETFRLFKANADRPFIGRLALEAFAGFRYSSAARAQIEHINFEDHGVALPGARLKTGRRKYVEGHPGALWKWLALAPAGSDCWKTTERQYLEEKSNAFTRAQVENPGNALRKGFCTYHMAVKRNAELTAFLLQHTSPKKLYDSYWGEATKREGLLYFLITPDAVKLTWEEFLASEPVKAAMEELAKEKAAA